MPPKARAGGARRGAAPAPSAQAANPMVPWPREFSSSPQSASEVRSLLAGGEIGRRLNSLKRHLDNGFDLQRGGWDDDIIKLLEIINCSPDWSEHPRRRVDDALIDHILESRVLQRIAEVLRAATRCSRLSSVDQGIALCFMSCFMEYAHALHRMVVHVLGMRVLDAQLPGASAEAHAKAERAQAQANEILNNDYVAAVISHCCGIDILECFSTPDPRNRRLNLGEVLASTLTPAQAVALVVLCADVAKHRSADTKQHVVSEVAPVCEAVGAFSAWFYRNLYTSPRSSSTIGWGDDLSVLAPSLSGYRMYSWGATMLVHNARALRWELMPAVHCRPDEVVKASLTITAAANDLLLLLAFPPRGFLCEAARLQVPRSSCFPPGSRCSIDSLERAVAVAAHAAHQSAACFMLCQEQRDRPHALWDELIDDMSAGIPENHFVAPVLEHIGSARFAASRNPPLASPYACFPNPAAAIAAYSALQPSRRGKLPTRECAFERVILLRKLLMRAEQQAVRQAPASAAPGPPASGSSSSSSSSGTDADPVPGGPAAAGYSGRPSSGVTSLHDSELLDVLVLLGASSAWVAKVMEDTGPCVHGPLAGVPVQWGQSRWFPRFPGADPRDKSQAEHFVPVQAKWIDPETLVQSLWLIAPCIRLGRALLHQVQSERRQLQAAQQQSLGEAGSNAGAAMQGPTMQAASTYILWEDSPAPVQRLHTLLLSNSLHYRAATLRDPAGHPISGLLHVTDLLHNQLHLHLACIAERLAPLAVDPAATVRAALSLRGDLPGSTFAPLDVLQTLDSLCLHMFLTGQQYDKAHYILRLCNWRECLPLLRDIGRALVSLARAWVEAGGIEATQRDMAPDRGRDAYMRSSFAAQQVMPPQRRVDGSPRTWEPRRKDAEATLGYVLPAVLVGVPLVAAQHVRMEYDQKTGVGAQDPALGLRIARIMHGRGDVLQLMSWLWQGCKLQEKAPDNLRVTSYSRAWRKSVMEEQCALLQLARANYEVQVETGELSIDIGRDLGMPDFLSRVDAAGRKYATWAPPRATRELTSHPPSMLTASVMMAQVHEGLLDQLWAWADFQLDLSYVRPRVQPAKADSGQVTRDGLRVWQSTLAPPEVAALVSGAREGVEASLQACCTQLEAFMLRQCHTAALDAQQQQQQQQQAPGLVPVAKFCCNHACTNLAGNSDADMPGLARCGKCKLAHYCSVECQRAGWQAGHSQVCKRVRDISATDG